MDPVTPGIAMPTPTSARRFRLPRTRAVFAGGVAVVLALGAAAGFLFLRGSGDVLTSIVPSSAGYYATVYLDPSGGEKVNLNNFLSKFPSVSTDAKRDTLINQLLDSALTGTGLTHSDVRDWLGSQVAVYANNPFSSLIGTQTANVTSADDVNINPTTSALPTYGVLISTTNDSKALAAVARVMKGTSHTDQHGGVTVTTVAGTSYAVVNHVLVIGDAGSVDSVIDTAQGKSSSLQASANYTATRAQLPNDSVALAYISGDALRDLVKTYSQLMTEGGNTTSPAPNTSATMQALAAYKGFGIAVTADSDGAEIDATATYDPSKLSASARAQLASTGDALTEIAADTPTGALGFFGVADAKSLTTEITSALSGIDSSIGTSLEKFGLTGTNGVLNHLSGAFGVEVVPAATAKGTPGVALVAKVDDGSAVSAFMTALPAKLGCVTTKGDPCPTTTVSHDGATINVVDTSKAAPPKQTDDNSSFTDIPPTAGSSTTGSSGTQTFCAPAFSLPPGVTMPPGMTVPPDLSGSSGSGSSACPAGEVPYPGTDNINVTPPTSSGGSSDNVDDLGVAPTDPIPAWTVHNGVLIIGTNTAAVESVLDANNGANITSSQAFKDAQSHADPNSSVVIYVNVASVAAYAESQMDPSDLADYNANVAPYISHIKTVTFTTSSGSDHSNLRVYVNIS